jgi:hypothetical protein
MEVQNVPEGTDRGGKRKATGYECMKRRKVIVEEQLEVERKEKDVLVTLLEQEKGRGADYGRGAEAQGYVTHRRVDEHGIAGNASRGR